MADYNETVSFEVDIAISPIDYRVYKLRVTTIEVVEALVTSMEQSQGLILGSLISGVRNGNTV